MGKCVEALHPPFPDQLTLMSFLRKNLWEAPPATAPAPTALLWCPVVLCPTEGCWAEGMTVMPWPPTGRSASSQFAPEAALQPGNSAPLCWSQPHFPSPSPCSSMLAGRTQAVISTVTDVLTTYTIDQNSSHNRFSGSFPVLCLLMCSLLCSFIHSFSQSAIISWALLHVQCWWESRNSKTKSSREPETPILCLWISNLGSLTADGTNIMHACIHEKQSVLPIVRTDEAELL